MQSHYSVRMLCVSMDVRTQQYTQNLGFLSLVFERGKKTRNQPPCAKVHVPLDFSNVMKAARAGLIERLI